MEEVNRTLDDFAKGIGRLVEARDNVIEALFDPQSPPDLLTELTVSDANRSVTGHVMQRLSGGIVRGMVSSPVDSVPPGATVINSRHHTATPIDGDAFARVVAHFADQHPIDGVGKLLETGIKVIDVMCPLVTGGTVAIAGEVSAGAITIMEELVRRLSGGTHRISLFLLLPQWEAERTADFSHADALHRKGFSEGTVGMIQTFFLRAAGGPWTADRLGQFASVDTVIHVSRDMATMNIYPCVDPRTSRLLYSQAISDAHAAIAERARQAFVGLMDPALAATTSAPALGRVRKLANFFAQPFYCAEPWTKRPGAYVSLQDSLITCAEILDGRYDD